MRFYPDEFILKIFPKSFWTKDILNSDLKVKRTMIKYLAKARVVAGDDLLQSIENVIKKYKEKSTELKASGERAFKKNAVNGEVLLKQRIKNIVVQSEVEEIKDKYTGGYYKWLPSGAQNPDPEHQLLYGKIFKIGEGDKDGNMPGERYGCQCGMELLPLDKKNKSLNF